MTPRIPPSPVAAMVSQYGNPCHQPTMTRPGSTKMIADNVPAALATVWTMLFSRMFEDLKSRKTAMEITAAGIEVAKVSPTLSPRYTLAAVKPRVINAPRMIARTVSSGRLRSLEEFNARSPHIAHQFSHGPAECQQHGTQTHGEIDDVHILPGHGGDVIGIEF